MEKSAMLTAPSRLAVKPPRASSFSRSGGVFNDQIKGVADRLAEVGYRAFVPDLYRGKVTLVM